MFVPWRQGVGDLMKNRIANLIFRIQKRQMARQRDPLFRDTTRPKTPPSVIKCERPAGEVMLVHQRDSQSAGNVQIH